MYLALFLLAAPASAAWVEGERTVQETVWKLKAPGDDMLEVLTDPRVAADDAESTKRLKAAVGDLATAPADCQYHFEALQQTSTRSVEGLMCKKREVGGLPAQRCLTTGGRRETGTKFDEYDFIVTDNRDASKPRTVGLRASFEAKDLEPCKVDSVAKMLDTVGDSLRPGKPGEESENPAQKEEKRKVGKAPKTPAKKGKKAAADSTATTRAKKKQEQLEKAAAEKRARDQQGERERMLGYVQGGYLSEAELRLDDILQNQPATPRLRFQQAGLMKLLGKPTAFDNAAALAKDLDSDGKLSAGFLCKVKAPSPAVRTRKRDACEAISDGLIREAFGDPAGALEAYDDAVAIDPRNWMAHAYRGILHVSQHRCPPALNDLQMAVTLNPPYRPYSDYYVRQCPAAPAPPKPAEASPENPFPESSKDLTIPGR